MIFKIIFYLFIEMSYQQNVVNSGNNATQLSDSTSKKRIYNNIARNK